MPGYMISVSRYWVLTHLEGAYRARYEQTEDLEDLLRSIKCGAEAAAFAPDVHPSKPQCPGSRYTTRITGVETFDERQGPKELQGLNRSIEIETRALSLIPDNHLFKPSKLSDLGSSYFERFRRTGGLADLNKAIECGINAVSLTPDGLIGKQSYVGRLGSTYLARFIRLGELVDLNEAIQLGIQAVSFTPDGHADKSIHLRSLGNSYRIRFERLGELRDLNKSIELISQAVSLTPAEPTYLGDLGSAYIARFEHLDGLVDLNKAIEYGIQAVSLIPDGHSDKPYLLTNLGGSYHHRFERLGELMDLNKAIERKSQAVALTPHGHADRPAWLNNLGHAHRARFERLGELVDVNLAIEYEVEAVALTPNDHVHKAKMLINLGASYRTRYARSGSVSDLESGIASYREAAQLVAGSPYARFSACCHWAGTAAHHATSSPYPAYQQGMELLPQLIWIGTTLDRRYSLIAQFSDFATEAAAYAISINNLALALEWLEAGRSIVWGQIAQLRTPFEQLSTKDANLANQLKEIGRQLESAGSRSSATPSLEGTGTDLDQETSSHVQLALAWDKLVDKARSIPGLEDFLRAPKSNQLHRAAKSHPIAIINVHESRCDALILQPNKDSISHVPLIDFSKETAFVAREHLATLAGHRGFVRANKSTPGSLERTLRGLWFGVVKPVLDFLGYTHRYPVDQLPRLTWCTTDILSFLPLHAAGCYDGSQAIALDLVISSYTPTISALIVGQSTTPEANCRILAVGQEHTPGFNNLPCIKDELRIIETHSRPDCYLQLDNNEATITRVLDAMDKFSWVHLACHGTQNSGDPTQSAFHLYDGSLTLAMITQRSFANKGLAFLSACETAAGDKDVPDEAAHLAAGLLMAGFPSVIGTMWGIADADGTEVADKVYAELLKDDVADYTKSARALHKAITHLRTKVGGKAILRWAPFIHIGA